MTTNPLSSAGLGGQMAASLPLGASPQFKSIYDVIALAVHASMRAVDFRLIGLSEDHRFQSSEETSEDTTRLPENWNESNGNYSFTYAHGQSSMEFVIKVSKMGSKVVVMGIAIGDDRTCSFDVTAKEYALEDKFSSVKITAETTEADAREIMNSLFLTPGRLSDFGSLMLVQIIQKLAPSINKGGQREQTDESDVRTERQRREPERPPPHDPLRDTFNPPARPHPFHDPLMEPTRPFRPMPDPMPGFEDEYEMQRPPRSGIPAAAYPRIGDRDLYPADLGPHDPLYGGVGPGLGPMRGGGMHPTFDDPLFTGQARREPGYDPQAPPGSRYDPVGPDMGGHPRGAGMHGRPPNPFGGFGDGDFI